MVAADEGVPRSGAGAAPPLPPTAVPTAAVPTAAVPTAAVPTAGPRRRRWSPRRRRAAPDAMEVLAAGTEIAVALRGGIGSPRATDAAHRMCRLLGADAIGLVDIDGAQVWTTDPADGAGALVERVLRGDRRAGRSGLLALPLLVRDDVAGVIVIDGEVRPAAARHAATWVAQALERGRMEASARAAEQAELRALRAEISPHFVYNTLTTIASFVRSDPARARDLILDFAEFIRHNLARGEYTTLAGEFRAIEAYLALARAVLGDRLRVQVRIAPEVLPVAVPFLALQPLVENAVQHGVEHTESGGTVQVSGEATGGECLIVVEDDGPGMAPEHAREILAGRGFGSGIGLVNVDRRLRAIYGAAYGLTVETAPGAGTRVLMRVPRFTPGVVAR